MKKLISFLFFYLFITHYVSEAVAEIKEHSGFIVRSLDNRYEVISPAKYQSKMEVVIENKTNLRMLGRIMINRSRNIEYVSIEPGEYKKYVVDLKKNDVLHYLPLNPAFQEIELIVGNKFYEIPPK